MNRKWNATLVAALSVAAGACDFGQVVTYDLPRPASVDVSITVLAEEPDAAQVLGWAERRIPRATVLISSTDPERAYSWEGIADVSGVVSIENVPVGDYSITVERQLDEDERRAVASLDINGFAAVVERTIGSAGPALQLETPASRRRGLVISEIFSQSVRYNVRFYYTFSNFIEIYNNSDSTIYLDGKTFGLGFPFLHDASPARPCDMFHNLRADPAGIWARFFDRFPGSGRDYPVHGGEAVVIATDAIDHRVVAPDALDLRGADFEFRGLGDVDNPAVPDMISIGLEHYPLGRGLLFSSLSVYFLAEYVDTEQLPARREPDNQREWRRIPAEKVLDTVVQSYDNTTLPDIVMCSPLSDPGFSRGYVRTLTDAAGGSVSLQRRTLFRDSAGNAVLQHTRTPGADFIVAPLSPRVVGAAAAAKRNRR